MVRKSLLAAAALLVATPLAAQDGVVWSSLRPDGHAPVDIRADRTLQPGELQVSYRFSKLDDKGIWFDNDSIPLSAVFSGGDYEVVPLSQNSLGHEVEVAYGINEELTVLGRVRYLQLERRNVTSENLLFLTEADELGDSELHLLWNVFRQEAFTANIRGGVLIPTGADDVSATTPFSAPGEEPLAYGMRPGAGVFAAIPGATAQMQNEFGTVGAQIQGRIHFGTNDSGFTPGDRLNGTVWAAYKLNEAFSVSARLGYESWTRLEGFDPALDPTRDPTNETFFAEGSLVTLPVGLNFIMPEGSPLAGYRFAVEYIYPVDQEYEGPQLGFSRGLVVGVQASF